jgi:hypothetical protein
MAEAEMSKLRPFKHARTILLIAVATVALVAPQARAAKAKRSGERLTHEPRRVMAIAENGPIVTFRLENGQNVDVAKSLVKVKVKNASRGESKEERRAERAVSLSDLAQMSAPAAVVTLSYDRAGNVKKAKVRVFRNEAEVSAFFADRSARLATAGVPNKEQHR